MVQSRGSPGNTFTGVSAGGAEPRCAISLDELVLENSSA